MRQFIESAAERIAAQTPLDREAAAAALTTPPKPEMGDLAFPCFTLSKPLRQAPNRIAEELAGKIAPGGVIAEVKAMGPYLNFFLDRAQVAAAVLTEAAAQGEDYGRSDRGAGQTIVIDYSSPNIAKHLSIGHLPSTVIGAALYRLFQFLGYRVVGVNHVGDWGTQFGQLIVAFKKWGSEKRFRENPVTEMNALYVRFHREAENDPALLDEARAWLKKLEDGDPEAVAMWRRFREESIKEFERAYRRLGVHFDDYSGESFFNDKMAATVERIKAAGIARVSDGALVVDVGDDVPPCLILRKDGATLYATRDICAAEYRREHYGADRLIYVVGSPQKLHFRQVFTVLKKMGYDWADQCVHVDFGQILLGDGGKMSSRKGNVILLNDVLDEAVARARKTIEEKNPDLEDKDAVAEAVGLGAVVFARLSNRRIKDVSFSWEEILNFEGETGPYVQYTHVRACSILDKYGRPANPNADAALLTQPEEYEIVKALARFGETVERAADEYEPSVLCRYLLDLCSLFNNYYHKHRIIDAGEGVADARVLLVDCVRQVLANGLRLLGVQAPRKM